MSGGDDPYRSFGRCYFDSSGDEAPDRFIPCGNVNFGNVSCCQSGNVCLSSNACYDGETGMTYRAGCTDESYADDSCPDKGQYGNEAWLGYTYCNGTSNEWVGCDDNHGAATVTPTSPCWCPEETAGRIVPFNDASSLANVVSLPTATDGRLEWQGGFLPSTESVAGGQPTGGAESTSSSGSRPASISASTTVQSTEINGTPTVQTSVVTQTVSADTGSSSSGLSTAAKAGIGAGAGLAALALGALIIWILLRSRRRRRSGAPVGSGKLEKSSAASSPEQQQTTSLAATGGTGHKPQHGRYYDNQASAPAVFGHKSELDAVENKSTTPVIPSPRTDEFGRPRSELPADAGRVAARTSAEGRVLGDGGWEIPGQMGTVYEKPT